MTFVSEALGRSSTIGSRLKEVDFRVAVGLCNYGRDVIGCYLRRDKMVREPESIQRYREIYELLVLEQKKRLEQSN
jgi:hypothetical protein